MNLTDTNEAVGSNLDHSRPEYIQSSIIQDRNPKQDDDHTNTNNAIKRVDETLKPDTPIVLPLINRSGNPEVLIFSVEEIKRLRKHGILGVLIGTLAQYPQQNFYLSIPLRLILWEVIWLIDQGLAVLVDYVQYRLDRPKVKSNNAILLSKNRGDTTADTEANFVRIPNDDELESIDVDRVKKHEVSILEYLRKIDYESPDLLLKHYHNYKFLKGLEFFTSPGLKFGGDLVIYPGDPLKFHSYSIVKFNCIKVNDLVIGGRLATGVKKNYVMIDDIDLSDDSGEINEDYVEKLFKAPKKKAFSIEWAGFG